MTLYSERFILNDQPNTWRAFTVPTGSRAVVRSVLAHNATGAAGIVQVAVVTTVVVSWTLPATPTLMHLDTRLVVYPGEALAAYVATAGQVIAVAGYLFRELGAGRAPPTQDFSELAQITHT